MEYLSQTTRNCGEKAVSEIMDHYYFFIRSSKKSFPVVLKGQTWQY